MANDIKWAADTAAVAGLDTASVVLALLPDATGFDWKATDSTRAASFDPNEHIVVPGVAYGAPLPLTAGAWHRRLPGDQPQLRDFGAKGDGDSYGGVTEVGAIASGQAALTIAQPRFKAGDVGSAITVARAGPPDVHGVPTTLASTIVTYVSETEVTLADAASSTVLLTQDRLASWRGASMVSGQPTLLVRSPIFTVADVGKTIVVAGASFEDVLVNGVLTRFVISLVTTIAAFTNATTVTLVDSAPVTVAGAQIYWGTDDTAAIQDAINFMASYPLRSRALDLPRGMFMFSNLFIPGEIVGLSLNGVSYWDSTLMCFEHSDAAAIWNKSQEFKMFDMTLMSALPSAMNKRTKKSGLRNDKEYTPQTLPVADVDCVISRCRISAFSSGIYHKGRSLVMRGFNHIATCDWGVEFEWPDEADYEPGTGVMTDYLGFRGNIIEGLRCHSMGFGAVLNNGTNAHKIWGLKLDNIILDIGRHIFKGHLGTGGMLTNSASLMTPLEVVVLTGGSNFTVANINAIGARPPGEPAYTPKTLIRLEAGGNPGPTGTTGKYRAGIFSNVQLAASEQSAVVVEENTQLLGLKFDDFTFDGIGTDAPLDWSAFDFVIPEPVVPPVPPSVLTGTVEINRPLMIGGTSRRSFVHNDQALKTIYLNGARRVGSHSTPLASGTAPVVIENGHYQYTPTLTATTNAGATTVSVWDYVYLSGGLVQVSGQCTVKALQAGNCTLQISLPTPSNFTGSGQASGSFIAGNAGSNIAGVADSNGSTNAFEVRWVAPDTAIKTFAFVATYRVI